MMKLDNPSRPTGVAALVNLAGLLVTCTLVLLLLPSLAVSTAALLGKHLPHPTTWFGAGLIVQGVVMAGVLVGVNRLARRLAPTRILWILLVASFCAKVLIILTHGGYQQGADTLFFRDFVVQMADRGIQPANMAELSKIWDYQLWFGRSFPFMYPLRVWFGSHDLVVVQLLQALCLTGVLALTFALVRRVFGDRTALLATAWLAVSPVQSWLSLDYSHQPQGALWLMLGFYAVVLVLRGETGGWRLLGIGIGLGLVQALLFMQSGLDMLLWVVLLVAAGLGLVTRPGSARIRLLLVLVVLPALVYVPARKSFQAWSDSYNVHRLGSGLVSIIAHGWNHQRGGEYYGPYDQIDRVSPVEVKADEMKRIIVSTFVHEPVRTAGPLMLVKVAKYFLVGSASGIEERLQDSGYPRSSEFFRGLRVAYLSPVLLAAVWGLVCRLRTRDWTTPAVLMFFIPVAAALLFAILGQTSPRYSLYVHGMMALAAALAFRPVEEVGDSLPWRMAIRRGVFTSLALVLLYVVGAGAVLGAAPALARAYVYQDLRSAAWTGTVPPQVVQRSTLEQEVVWPGPVIQPGQTVAATLPVTGEGATARLTFFLWQFAGPSAAQFEVEVSVGTRVLDRFPLSEVGSVRRCAYELDADPSTEALGLRVVYRGDTALELNDRRLSLRWGYVYRDRL